MVQGKVMRQISEVGYATQGIWLAAKGRIRKLSKNNE